MKFKIENLGKLEQADIEISDLTVICGENNSGKTYATYAIYGFLRMWAQNPPAPHPLAVSTANALPQTGVQRIDLLNDLLPTADSYFDDMSKRYNNLLSTVFASREDYFENTKIHFTPDQRIPNFEQGFQDSVKVGSSIALIFSKDPNSSLLEITRPSNLQKSISNFAIATLIDNVFRTLLWKQMVPDVHISSTERTGAAVFHRSLNFARDRALNTLSQLEANRKQHDAEEFITKLFLDYRSDYPLPVEDNVKLIGNLESISKSSGKIAAEHPEILKYFDAIVGGSYKATKEGVYYLPKGSKTRLAMAESSSVVRSLLDFSFYLRHILKPGDLLIVDEPEMSLHPANQRLLARLLARLVNLGVRVFVTTHSDYIIRELNALIVMSSLKENQKAICSKFGYEDAELLKHEKIRVYTACSQKNTGKGRKGVQCLAKQQIDPRYGIEISSFDDQISQLNELQDFLINVVSEEDSDVH